MKKIQLNNILLLFFIFFFVFTSFYYFKLLFPFFIGIFIAYLLNPIVDFIENNISRSMASLIITILFFGFIVLFSFSVVPVVIQQTLEFLERFPNLVNQLEKYLLKLADLLDNKILDANNVSVFKDFHSSFSSVFKTIINKLFLSSIAIINIFSLVIITPIVTWYFLKDWNKVLYFIKKNIPNKYERHIIKSFKEIDVILSSFIRGQVLVSLVLGIYYCLAFYILGIDYSLFLGIFSGIFSIVPYFGIIFSFILSIYISILQFTELYFVLYIILIFLISFLFEGYYLSPKIIGDKLGLHPLAILYSVFVFGSLLGIIGIFFSIPFASIIFLYYKKLLAQINNS